jgi:probable HAF family extracellular repeat protein
MRSREGVMRYLCIATAACAALYIFDDGVRAAGGPAANYSITDLGSLGGGRTTPMGINNRGAVVGFSNTVEGLTRGFLYTGGSLVDLGTLGGDESFAYRINDNGLIVGRAQDESGRFHAFVTRLSGGAITMSSLDARVDGDFGAALGINSAGDVAGYYTTAGEHMSARNRVFLYRDFRVTDIGAFGGEDGVVVAVNDGGSMAGFFSLEPHADYAQHGSFLFTGGRPVPIGSLGGKLTTARDLNNRDDVVGDGDAGDGDHHAFLFAGGQLRDLGTLAGGRQSAAYAINERGDIVGFSDGRDGSARAIIITAGVMRDLNGLIASDSGWVLTHARDINATGRIVGIGWLNGEQRGFLLTP